MRRSIALIALLSLVAAGAPAGGRGDSSMACCRGTSAMACCLPAAGCAMKSCPAPRAQAMLPGLPPAVLVHAAASAAPALTSERPPSLPGSPLFSASSPPEQPPRV